MLFEAKREACQESRKMIIFIKLSFERDEKEKKACQNSRGMI